MPQAITCDLGALGGLPPDGDYRLTIAGVGRGQSDAYDLTIGAAGPPGAVDLESVCTRAYSEFQFFPEATNEFVKVSAACPTGFRAIAGGWNSTSFTTACSYTIYENGYGFALVSWGVTASADNARCGNTNIRAEAMCCPNQNYMSIG